MPDVNWLLHLPEGITPALALLFMFLAAAGAIITSALGAGGGAVLLVLLAQWIPPAALIPVHGLTQFGANLSRAFLTRRHIRWPVVAAFAPGVVVGAWLASLVLVEIPQAAWQVTIALFVLWLCWGPPLPTRALGSAGTFIAAILTSFASLFVGATGPLVAAFLKQATEGRFQTISTFAMAMTLQHAPKAVAFGALGFVLHEWLLLILLMIGATVIGNRIGLHLLSRLSDRRFHYLFNLVLTLLALRLLWLALTQ